VDAFWTRLRSRHLHHGYIDTEGHDGLVSNSDAERMVQIQQCIFAGGEMGSTGVKMTWSLPDGLVSAAKLNANDNFAPQAYALAA